MSDSVSVVTGQGRLAGRLLDDGGAVFAGIPYAEPPVGALRLRPPQPPRRWEGVRDATRFRAAPPQTPHPLSPPGAVYDEDCLHVNVWTPDIRGRRPVMVWIYGGAFESGSATPPTTDGQWLMRGGDVVVVSFHYRVGALGFAHLSGIGGEAWAGTANLGLQDQVAALRWVRENITRFGGDPDNVTLFGNSAGASAIGCLLAMPSARGLFRRAVMMSPPIARIYAPATADRLAADLLDALGVTRPEQLADVPAERILSAQAEIVPADMGVRALPGGRAWGPVLDGTVLPRTPLQAAAAGDTKGITLLIGANRDEMLIYELMQQAGGSGPQLDDGTLYDEIAGAVGAPAASALIEAYRAAEPDATPARLRLRFLGDHLYRVPAWRMAEAHTRAGGTAYRYLFSADLPVVGSAHGMEVPFVFGGHDKSEGALSQLYRDWPGSAELGHRMTTAWAEFARTGDPGWAPHSPGAVQACEFGSAMGFVAEPPASTAAAWALAVNHPTVPEVRAPMHD
ncbi:carboxylesterase/lipase family protein [Yinghuangia sp. YIM S10712]|uniref:carboxylesterase/lipase family protein n=1 Tax=Yinghuangia sp. YIM S10712 TaxID=3436930 RepID=UPI003F52AC2A